MSYLPLITTVTIIHLLAVISPGPDFIMCVRNALTYSRKTGILTAIGLAAGVSVHIFYCIAGLALIISKSILVFNSIKLLGAAYLIYIGIKSLLSKSGIVEVSQQTKKEDITSFKAMKIGFITNVLNPKATIYFLSLFTMVITPDTPPAILGILSLIMIIATALWFSLVAIFFTHKKIQGTFNKFQNIFNRTFGGLLIALGVKVALSNK